MAAGFDQRPLIVDERQAFRRGQFCLDLRRHLPQDVGRVLGPVVTARVDVREHPWLAAPVVERDARGCVRHHGARAGACIRCLLGRGKRVAHRDLPQLAWRGRAVDEEAAFRQRDGRRIGRRARQRDADERHARLIDERRQHPLDRLARAGGDGLPEILGRRVRVRVRLQVRVDACAERFGADVALDHAQDRRALLVRDGVERLVDLRGRVGVGVNGTCGSQRVEPERRAILPGFVDSDLPFRMERGERLVGHPRGESFVQPDVVPPRHRHEVAEPLVRHLVRHDGRDVLARRHRR